MWFKIKFAQVINLPAWLRCGGVVNIWFAKIHNVGWNQFSRTVIGVITILSLLLGSHKSVEYSIAHIFCGSKFLQIAVFDNFVGKIFANYYTVELLEAGDGVKCQNFRWNILWMALNSRKLRKFRPTKYKRYTVVLLYHTVHQSPKPMVNPFN